MHYWQKEKPDWRNRLAVIVLAVVSLSAGIVIGNISSTRTVTYYNDSGALLGGTEVRFAPVIYEGLENRTSSGFASVKIPAVDEEGNGVITAIHVQAVPGSGRVLANIDKLLFWVDTQNSIRRATQVAEKVRGINVSRYDLVYTIQANASVIGGPSAGAAITVATIAALENRSVNQSVMITGSVNHDGTIGPVGGILEKAQASAMAGAQTFLVPLTQSVQTVYKTRQYCEKIGWADFCTTETYPVKVDIKSDVDIGVAEVMDIQEAMEYMII
jgi:uncharacterized protein